MAETFQVEPRLPRGKRFARRERQAGKVPAVLYGHGQEVLPLSLDGAAVLAAVRHGARLVELTGAVQESAFIREVQWDTFGTEVLHVDFSRVSADEQIEVTLPVEMKGTAPGVKDGGVVQQPLHELTIECPAGVIPEKLLININHLALGQVLTVAAVDLPAGAKLVTPADIVVVQCQLPVEQEDLEAGPGATAEPELIGRKAEDEEAAEE
ncbi:MAG: 50S ribosomal protein L25 [Planctomycetia bacterium]|nr:50S ribosomal protein L25 [Planctomycetia bacterium]